MSFLDNYNDPIIYRMRKGNSDDPYLPINQTDKVRNNIIQLKEIPDKFSGITVSDGTNTLSIKSEGLPEQDDVVVDWTNGILKFNDLNNNKTYTINFHGKGSVFAPASKIYTQTDENGEVTEVLQELTDAASLAKDEANSAAQTANEKASLAEEKANAANTAAVNTQAIVDETKFIAPYNTTTTYKKNNIVSLNGASYIAKRTTTGNTPTDSPTDLNWGIVARKGNDGTGTVTTHTDKFIATEGQKLFTLQYTYDQFQNRTKIIVGGVTQKTPENYEETTNNSISFYEGLPAGVEVIVDYFSESIPLQSDIQTVVNNHTGIISDHSVKLNETTTQLEENETKLGNIHVDVDKEFQALTGETDDTARIQRAIDSVGTTGGTVFLKSKTYIVNGQLVIKAHGINIVGVYGKNGTGTLIKTTLPNSNLSVLKIQRPSSGNIQGTIIKNINFLGSTHFATGDNSVDRPCIELVDAYRLHMSNVAITGFLRQALLCNKVWDSNFIDVQIHFCGTDNLYPAIELTGVGGVNSNANHWFGVYVEFCPFMLKLDALARHNQFVACKFERGDIAYTGNVIHITSTAYENVFMGCHIVCNDATPLGKGHFFKIDNAYTTISNSMFTSQYSSGSKWIKHTSVGGVITGNIFNQCYAEEYPFELNDKVNFNNNQIYSNVGNAKKNLFTMRNSNLIKDNHINNKSAETAPTSGNIFNLTGTKNVIKDNPFNGSSFKLYNPTSTNNVFQLDSKELLNLPLGATAPSVAGGEVFVTVNTSATTITNFSDGYNGQRITIIFGDGLTTISGTNFKLKGGASMTGNGGGDTIEFIYNGSVWYEISRSDNT